jgi:hypothetical protein
VAEIFDEQISKFTSPYTEKGRRPLPKWRYARSYGVGKARGEIVDSRLVNAG